MVSPTGDKSNERVKPNENDIIGPYPHQKLNGWDYCAAFPILGNATSVVRTVANLGQVICGNENKKSTSFKASINGLKKGAIEIIPVVGTVFAIYVLYKNYKNEKKIIADIPFKTPKEEAAFLARDWQPEFNREPERFSLSSNPESRSSIPLGPNVYHERMPQEDAGDLADFITEVINNNPLEPELKSLLSEVVRLLGKYSSGVFASAEIAEEIQRFNFKGRVNELNPINNDKLSAVINSIIGDLDKLQEEMRAE